MLRTFKISRFRQLQCWLSDTTKRAKIRYNLFALVFIKYCIDFFVLCGGKWYATNYKWYDNVDTLIMFIIFFDAFIKNSFKKYDDCNIIAIALFLLIIGTNLAYRFSGLSYIVYIDIYRVILIVGVVVLSLLKIEKYFL